MLNESEVLEQLAKMKQTIDDFDISKYQDWIAFYSKRTWVQVQFNIMMETTAAINLQDVTKPILMLNPIMIKEHFNYTDEEMFMDVFHELEHLKEQAQMMWSSSGRDINEQNKQRLEDRKHLRKAFGIYKTQWEIFL